MVGYVSFLIFIYGMSAYTSFKTEYGVADWL